MTCFMVGISIADQLQYILVATLLLLAELEPVVELAVVSSPPKVSGSPPTVMTSPDDVVMVGVVVVCMADVVPAVVPVLEFVPVALCAADVA